MNRNIILCLLALVVTVDLSAQHYVEAEGEDDVVVVDRAVVDRSFNFSVGLKAGGNYALAKNPANMELGLKGGIGYQGGLALNAHFGRRNPASPGGTGWVGVQLEGNYAYKNLTTDGGAVSFMGFEVPLLAQIYVIPSLCIEVGPTFTGMFCNSTTPLKASNAEIFVNNINAYDVMLSVGVGFKSRIGLTGSVRYNLGNSDLAGNFGIKVSTISVAIGWLFKFVK